MYDAASLTIGLTTLEDAPARGKSGPPWLKPVGGAGADVTRADGAGY